MRTVLFYRHFERFAGHHLKVWDYFNHVLASPDHTAVVRFTRETRMDETNPWYAVEERILRDDRPVDPDLLFLSGMDWRLLDREGEMRSSVPVINLIQHVMHVRPDNPRYAYLTRKAIRICVSPEVEQAVAESGRAQGPLFTIPNGIAVQDVTRFARADKDVDVAVAAIKAPELGARLTERLNRTGRKVVLLDRLMSRAEFLSCLGRAKVSVFLPWRIEGFYMPALEGMALGTVVVCPDIVVNRSFCLPDVNCFRPAYDEDALVAAAEAALADLPNLDRMLSNGLQTAREHDLSRERKAFLGILRRVNDLWSE